MSSMTALRLGGRVYPVVLPSGRDPRLHLAAVIISIHVLGQTALGFRVSVPQILAAILTCAVIEVIWTFRETGQLVWPASAMLTGSGVALILRLTDAERGDPWSWQGWYIFAGVAAFSLVSKYIIRYHGSHLFNPSNLGLVVAFLVLGSTRVEPLDFWWAPLDGWMVAAYVIILAGGLLITSRLGLLAMAATFWLSFAAGLGLLAASGHCMTAAWAVEPVCGASFWRVLITSPEILIFLFFMITDPKTSPVGRPGRIAYAACLGVVCTLLIAPQTTEFGAKVGLLAGLVLMTPTRFLFDRFFVEQTDQRVLNGLGSRFTTDRAGLPIGGLGVFSRGALLGSSVVLMAAGIVAAGTPARQEPQTAPATASPELTVEIDPATLPEVTVAADVGDLNSEVENRARDLAIALAENLEIEGEAVLRADPSLLRAVDEDRRLIEMERRIEEGAVTGERVVSVYSFESLHLDVVSPIGSQRGASLGFEATGTVEQITYDADGVEQDRATVPFESLFVLRRASGDRWLIAEERPVSP